MNRLGEQMKIYVARYGQMLWNVQNRVCGRTDVELTKEGIEQAQKLAQEVKKYAIDFIIASPLKRAQQTSQIVAEENGLYPNQNVLLICHGGVSRLINTYFNDISNDDFFHYELENAKLQEYEI